MNELEKRLEALADNYNVPSITEWRQGKFIDQPRYYSKMDQTWKDGQAARERTLIRPGGGTNNALFQVSGSVHDGNIAEYLEALAKLLKELSS